MARRSRRDLSTHLPPITRHPQPVEPTRFSLSPKLQALRQSFIRLEQLRRQVLRDIEDRRRFHFDPVKPARTVKGTLARTRLAKAPQTHRLPYTLNFVAPKRVAICVRRQTRKEVIFAKGRAGGGRKRRSPKRNAYSSISCKR